MRTQLLIATALALTACGSSADLSTPTESPSPAAARVQVSIPFEAMVGATPFACGQTYEGLGTTGTTFTPHDLRLYVSALNLVDAAGGLVQVTLEDDGVWQHDGVALLDFEDATGGCTGTPDTYSTLVGDAPAGEYVGVSFTLGVPFEQNHQDQTLAPAPLNVTSMFWSWAAGYKFMRLDGATTGMSGGMYYHLGSTGCEMDDDGVVTGCQHPNRPVVELSFDLEADTVVLDVAALLEGTDLDTNTAGTAPVCMSEPADPDCAPSFAHLGLPFDGVAGQSAQTVFSVR